MGYNLIKRSGMNFGKGRRTLFRSFVPRGKAPDYYQKTQRGLDHVSTPISSDFETEESIYQITRQARHHVNQMSLLTLSSKIF